MRQRRLSAKAIEAFYHNDFVVDQTRDFVELSRDRNIDGTIVDIGGGHGYFAQSLAGRIGCAIRVIDMDPQSVDVCRQAGIEAECGDAIRPQIIGDESVVCFNLVLHHLVADTERQTRKLQQHALHVWHGQVSAIFINEYIYESFFSHISGRIIYNITKSRFLSTICRLVSRIVPSFRANTFGVGVRFRAHAEWQLLFKEAGFDVVGTRIGEAEPVALPLRGLLIKQIRRDSFWLRPTMDSR